MGSRKDNRRVAQIRQVPCWECAGEGVLWDGGIDWPCSMCAGGWISPQTLREQSTESLVFFYGTEHPMLAYAKCLAANSIDESAVLLKNHAASRRQTFVSRMPERFQKESLHLDLDESTIANGNSS